MSDVDFRECRVIKDCLCFLTFDEFCQYKKLIAKSFAELTDDGKLFYKFYIYANIHMELNYKDAIWNYVNLPVIENEFRLIDLSKKYRPHFIR